METDNTFKDEAGMSHILIGTLAFLGLALLAPVLRVIQVLFGG